jgi:hypothetical protein
VLDVVLIAVFLAWLLIKGQMGKSGQPATPSANTRWPAVFDQLDAINAINEISNAEPGGVGTNLSDYIPPGSLATPQDYQDWTNQWPSDIEVPLAPARPN